MRPTTEYVGIPFRLSPNISFKCDRNSVELTMKHLLLFLACTSLVFAKNLPTESPKSEVTPEEPSKFEAPNEVLAEVTEEPKAEEIAPIQEVDTNTTAEVELQTSKEIPSQEPETALEAPLTNPEAVECSVADVQQQEVVDESSAAQALEGKVEAERETAPTVQEQSDGEEPNPLSRINLGIGQSATNAFSPYGYSKSKVGAASLNIGLQNSWGGYRPLAQYGQSYGSSHRTGPYAPQTWGNAGAGPYGAYGKGGYRGGYGQTQSNAYNVQKRIPVAPGLSLLSNLDTDKEKERKAAASNPEVPAEDIQEVVEQAVMPSEPSDSDVKEHPSR